MIDGKKIMAGFLTKEDLLALNDFKYHGSPYTIMDNIFNPFWLKVAYAFPEWVAPNLITVTGLLINVASALILALYDPHMDGVAPSWTYVLAAVSLQIYSILDAADGKQARRLNASSPLGQIFDHGCDAVNLICILVTLMSSVGLHIGKTSGFLVLCMCSCFVAAQLLEYQSGILVSGSKFFGVTEAMICSSIVMLIAAFFGPKIYDIEMIDYLPFLKPYYSSMYIKYIVVVFFCVLISSITISFIISNLITNQKCNEEERGRKNLSRKDVLMRHIPILLMCISGWRLTKSEEIMNSSSLYVFFLIGLTFSFLSIRVNISHLCRKPLGYKFAGMYPLILAAINDYFKVIRSEIMIPFCFICFMGMFIMFTISTMIQIKNFLGIRAFHVAKIQE